MSINDVGQRLFDELGGADFLHASGAKEVVGTPNSLRMRVPSKRTNGGGTHVEVRVNEDGSYAMRLLKGAPLGQNAEPETLDTRSPFPAEALRATFTSLTGLKTS
jgi:hypothetical protein